MRYYLLLTMFSFYCLQASAQSCKCRDKFLFAKTSIEQNYSGVRDKINVHTRRYYDSLSRYYLERSSHTEGVLPCHLLIHDWLRFFRDGHIQIASDEYIDVDDSVATLARMKATGELPLAYGLLTDLKMSAIREEGVYISDDSDYTIAIIKNKSKIRDFAGVIIDSRDPRWHRGQVKLELLKLNNTKYRVVRYRGDHSFVVHDLSFDGTSFENGEWTKVQNETAGDKKRERFSVRDVAARTIGDSTIYVQIGTFDGANAHAIDSVFNALTPLLKKRPNLIIDLRGNGGGSDYSYDAILPWMYTGPIVSTGADVWSSPDNLNGWRKTVLENPTVPADQKKEAKELLEVMKRHPGTFISTGPDDTLILKAVEPYPKKIVVLTDNRSASSAEQLIFAAHQSSKVTVMGQSSKGVIDYTNVRQSPPCPCKDFLLFYATTRKRRLNMGKKLDNVGIPPDVVLSPDMNWVDEAVRYLSK